MGTCEPIWEIFNIHYVFDHISALIKNDVHVEERDLTSYLSIG